jgi:hypothetical protein
VQAQRDVAGGGVDGREQAGEQGVVGHGGSMDGGRRGRSRVCT